MGMMINRRRVYGGKSLPYDAEIEYLESSGRQWIDTGVIPTIDTSVEIDFRQLEKITNWPCILGSQSSDNSADSWLFRGGTSIQSFSFRIDGVGRDNAIVGISELTRHKAICSKSVFQIDDIAVGIGAASYTAQPKYNMYMFTVCNSGASNFGGRWFYGRIYLCKIYNGSTLVRDFIPVRIGQTGYMYDKVSGQLFGNSGTGSFILGPDK